MPLDNPLLACRLADKMPTTTTPSPQAIRRRLPHTWAPFFTRHGSLTAIQQLAMPPILDGQNVLLVAATAAGKTEAAVVPLLQRYFFPDAAAVDQRPLPQTGLRVLYICPTRALTKDLYERLARPLADLAISFAIKTGDTAAVSLQSPPSLLITTPESTDSLLTRGPRIFTGLAAVVLDEIHLFDHSERGDHLRCLLRRIEHIRAYHQQRQIQKRPGQPARPLQRIALSATVPDPAGVAERYLVDRVAVDEERAAYEIIGVPGQRAIDAEVVRIDGLADAVKHITRRAADPLALRKFLFFCNTRREVEESAAFLREHLPFAARVFVHYSNLDARLRVEVEADFAAASVALCVCTSTLELGIDIGSIDDVVLLGPPPTLTSFLQRIGRGGRRTELTRVLCLARSPLEAAHFQALLLLAEGNDPSTDHQRPAYHFRLSVLVQQTFSVLKQSPTGAIRLADLERVAPEPIDEETVRKIFRNLMGHDYLRPARLGEWRPGPALDELVDAHEIYSNIGDGATSSWTLIDAFTNKAIAQTGRVRMNGDLLLMGGRSMEVVWRDRWRLGVRPSQVPFYIEPEESQVELREPRITSAPFAVPLDVSQGVAAHLGILPNQLVLLPEEGGAWLFHFWGAMYGALLAGILQAQLDPAPLRDDFEDAPPIQLHNEHCLRLPEPLVNLPPWDDGTAAHELRRLAPRFAGFLNLGRFHDLLPPTLAHRVVIELCDVGRLTQLYREAAVVAPTVEQRERLRALL